MSATDREITLITGASAGIGYHLAKRLAAAGDTVIVLGRRRAPLDALAADIHRAGGRAYVAVADVTDLEGMAAALEQVVADTGPVTRLIANAGGGKPTFIDRFSVDDARQTWRVNLDGTLHSVAYVLADMRAARSGHLVFMGSIAAARGLPTAAAYSAAKAGVARFAESMAVDCQAAGIDVTLLEPGFVTKPGKRVKWPRMSMERATRDMAAAIIRRRPYWRGPRRLIFAAGVLRLLPSRAYNRLLAGRGRS